MKAIELTVNGELRTVTVEPRTQLAELLRDHLHLTGTHLGCEQGVCGACTVVFNGKPIRSCITYAYACDGAVVETIEGVAGDAIATQLIDAFSRHHALQCGFCTPGMLITARDLIQRRGAVDESTIRHELSGNLCRCTGYMGIVAAVREVGAATATSAPEPPKPAVTSRPLFAPFEPDELSQIPSQTMTKPPPVSAADGWTTVARRLPIRYPVETVWALFEDLPRVAVCIPGTTVTTATGNAFEGEASIHFGPIRAAFSGSGERTSEHDSLRGSINGQGRDANGQSTLAAVLSYHLQAAENETTTVALSIRFRLQGTLAQFNRGDLVESFADVVLRQFVDNCHRTLGGDTVEPQQSASGLALLWGLLRNKFRRGR